MPAIVPLDSTFGAMYIGAIVAIWLFGTSIVQLYIYFSRFPEDALHIKVLVSVLMFFDILQAAFISHLMYTILISNWGDVTTLDDVPWSLHTEVLTNAIVVFMVQCFFIRRLWVLSKRKHWLAILFFLVALVTLGSAFFFGIKSIGHQKFSKFHDYTPILIMWSVTDMILDAAIAALLWYYLHKSRSGIKSSDNIVDTLIIFTINTGTLTCTAATAHLLLFVASPGTGVHFAFHFVLAKLYTNSLYGSLNTRAVFRGKGESDRAVSGSTSKGTFGRSVTESIGVPQFATSHPRAYPPQRTIEITTTYVTEGHKGAPIPETHHLNKLGMGHSDPEFDQKKDGYNYPAHAV